MFLNKKDVWDDILLWHEIIRLIGVFFKPLSFLGHTFFYLEDCCGFGLVLQNYTILAVSCCSQNPVKFPLPTPCPISIKNFLVAEFHLNWKISDKGRKREKNCHAIEIWSKIWSLPLFQNEAIKNMVTRIFLGAMILTLPSEQVMINNCFNDELISNT